MKLTPVITEKTNSLAKGGVYTFYVDPAMGKSEIKNAVNETFGVHVVSIKTMRKRKRVAKNYLGRKRTIPAIKKAIVTLREKEKIDVFEAKGGKRK